VVSRDFGLPPSTFLPDIIPPRTVDPHKLCNDVNGIEEKTKIPPNLREMTLSSFVAQPIFQFSVPICCTAKSMGEHSSKTKKRKRYLDDTSPSSSSPASSSPSSSDDDDKSSHKRHKRSRRQHREKRRASSDGSSRREKGKNR